MDETDPSDHLILVRHPERGFLINGRLESDVADILCRYGFVRGDDNELLVPAAMPENDARDLLERAATFLARTKHSLTLMGDTFSGRPLGNEPTNATETDAGRAHG
ncbi:hypothetical protein [Amycolatopsis sp. NPDC004079]|uniref:hypothetical protein n=1 Tax=Amycolatopsis sp. NPDC004079 TaxID=3154549 RepID=UPI0033B2A92D